jgi:hypothetical protein
VALGLAIAIIAAIFIVATLAITLGLLAALLFAAARLIFGFTEAATEVGTSTIFAALAALGYIVPQ